MSRLKYECNYDCFNCVYPDCVKCDFDKRDRALLREIHELFEQGVEPQRMKNGKYPAWYYKKKEKALSVLGATEKAGT